ncbi:MFS transporter [Fundicoccus ignavus]|uniref:MFS transporter n=1 Tax=Fundicoccus ignavus TaxID=2664442 RepID=A0A844C9K1_9LACT|nr:MFS transporter [Fundicoccus ignavus]MRJ47127.1 MFS transporter [Fundicoccus ignavus]
MRELINQPKWVKQAAYFLGSQALTLLGSSLVQYAMMWHITLDTESGFMMTLYIICGFVPMFIVSPFAGVWADRYDRKWLIMLSDGGIAFATFILAILYYMGYGSNTLILVMAVVRAIGGGVQSPAISAILPQIVPKEALTKVNGVNASLQAVIMFISPMLSAGLLSLTTMPNIFMIDVVTAVFAIVVLHYFLKIPARTQGSSEAQMSYWEDFKLGLRYVVTHRFLKVFFALFAVMFILMAPVSFLTPLQITRNYGEEVWRLSALEMIFSIGMLLGGALITRWGGFSNRMVTIAVSGVVISICTILMGVLTPFWPYISMMGIFGIMMPFFNTPSTVIIQENVEEAYLGRVFGVLGMIQTSMMPLGMLVFGPLADIVKIEWMLIFTGSCLFLLSLYVFQNTTLRLAGEVSEASDTKLERIERR